MRLSIDDVKQVVDLYNLFIVNDLTNIEKHTTFLSVAMTDKRGVLVVSLIGILERTQYVGSYEGFKAWLKTMLDL